MSIEHIHCLEVKRSTSKIYKLLLNDTTNHQLGRCFLDTDLPARNKKKQQNKPARARMVEEDSTHLGQFFSALRSSSKWFLRLYYKLDIGKSMPGIRGVAFSLLRIAIFQDHLLLQHGDPKILASSAICHLPKFLDS